MEAKLEIEEEKMSKGQCEECGNELSAESTEQWTVFCSECFGEALEELERDAGYTEPSSEALKMARRANLKALKRVLEIEEK